MSLSITAATAADVPLILGFIRELADYERLSDQVSATEAALQATLFGERPAAEVLIARQDGVAAGFALFFQNYSTFLAKPGIYLEDLYVKPEQRGHGIGRALLTHIARLAVARDCGRFEWSVLDWNAPAIGFYRSLGALPQDEWTIMRLSGDALKALASSN
ncbi:N-acetyltransferase family protein [Hydrocarboniphaga sp.]|uniref:GNAT family N-acetyltransferase n=1 Tax=Hydrocarboniphaga sp. TaxID=2033016 RepID=UPI003D136B79